MLQIKPDIYWVGHIDWDLRIFHGYSTPEGTTYNAYLIHDECPTLIDTVKDVGREDFIRNIKEVMDPAKIRYIVANHAEMDHSGAIDDILALAPEAEVVCSVKAREILTRHFKKPWRFRTVQDGEELSIGKRKLRFLYMPMVHWPESMSTYSEFDRVLFPNDAFGQHYACKQRFTDEVGADRVLNDTAKYYANIVLPFGGQVLKALDSCAALAIEAICPSHGLIWRNPHQIQMILSYYRKWAQHQTDTNRVLIVYDTMWKSTEMMARKFLEFFHAEHMPAQLFSLQEHHISDIVTELLFSRALLVGTPILNSHMLPTMAAFLMYLKGLKPKKRVALSFGSYGWSKSGFKEVETFLTAAGLTMATEGRYCPYVPDQDDLDGLQAAALMVKAKMVEVS